MSNLDNINNNTDGNSTIHFTNIQTFPKVGTLPGSEKVRYVGHYNTITKIIIISTEHFPNHMISIGDDRKICIWNIQENKCEKIIKLDYLAYDIIQGDGENILVCGEFLEKIDIVTEKVYYTIKPKIGKYKEYSGVAIVNDKVAAVTSMNRKFVLFEIATGKILKTIRMNCEHYICKIENEHNERRHHHKQNDNDGNSEEKKEDNDEEDEDEDEEKDRIEPLTKDTPIAVNNNIISSQQKSPNQSSVPLNANSTKEETEKIDSKRKKIRNIGSALCLETKESHKGYVYIILGINTEEFPNGIITGGNDNVIKITKTDNNEVINFVGHEGNITAISLMGKKLMLSGSFDRSIRKWNLLSRQCEEVIEKHSSVITMLIPLNDKLFLSSAVDRYIKIWDEEGKCVKTFTFSNGVLVTWGKVDDDKYIYGDSKGELFMKQINW